MNKKITSSALAALMIAGSTSFSALAAMANGTVVIGNKAFDINYANDPAHAAEITNAVVAANGAVFVKNFDGEWIDNNTNAKVLASMIPAVTYKSATGVETKFDAMDKDQMVGEVAVKVIDVAKVEVKFAVAVDPAKVTVTLKQGLATQYTTAVFAADNKSVILTAPTAIAAGAYNVVVTGMGATEVVTPITVVAATPTAVAVTNTQATIGTGSVISFSVTNQYGTDMGVIGANAELVVTAYDITSNTNVVVSNTANSATKSEKALDLSNATNNKLGDDVRVIVSYKGLTTTKTVKIIGAATVSDIALGTVVPLATKTRITAGETGLIMPYTLKNQFGEDVKLAAGTIAANPAITFVSSNNLVVNPSTFAIDSTGKLTFTAGTAGTTTITTIINATGRVATTTVTVSAAAALKTVVVATPTTLLSAGQTAKLKLTGLDQYGTATTDFTPVTVTTTTTTAGTTIVGTITNGVLNITASAAGTATLTLSDGASTPTIYGTITVKFEAAAVATAITGLATPTTLEAGVIQTIDVSDILVKDQYGRDFDLTTASQVAVTKVDNTNTTATIATNSTDYSVTASTTPGAIAIKFTLPNLASYTANYNVVPTASIVNYSITGAKTVYANTTALPENYTVNLGVEGMLADGTKVVLNTGKITNATSSNLAVATVTTAGAITGLTKGTTTIALWNGATKLAETVITVDTVAPVATTVAFDETTPLVATTVTPLNLALKLSVKDQYGVKANTPGGFWASSNAAVATVNPTTGLVTRVSNGQVTITYVTPNGIVKTVAVTVQ